MVDKPKKRRIFMDYALDTVRNKAVVPEGTPLIGNDGLTETYNRAVHYGHLACPGCETPVAHEKAVKAGAGDKTHRRARFRSLAPHEVHCSILEEYLEGRYPSQERVIDPNKGPFFYINTGQRRASSISGSVSNDDLPLGIRHVEYGLSEHHDYRVMLTAEFRDRPRVMPVNSPASMARLYRTLSPEKIDDVWAINNEVAIRLKRLFAVAVKEGEGQSASMKRLLGENIIGIKHPVFLQFDAEKSNVTRIMRGDNPRVRVELARYKVPNPSWNGKNLALPEIWVQPYVHVKAKDLFGLIMEGGQFIGLVHPYVKRDEGINGMYRQHFDLLRMQDIVKKEQTPEGPIFRTYTLDPVEKPASKRSRPQAEAVGPELTAVSP